jgi:hypothetical protein
VILGAVANGGVTDDRQPRIQGTAEAGAVIAVYDDGILIGTVTADAAGAWSFTPPAPLSEGNHALTVTATDAAGNASGSSTAFAFTVDSTAPVTPQTNPTDGVTLSGTAEPGSTVELDIDGDGEADLATKADAQGGWTVTLAEPLADGTVVGVVARDVAGNASPAAAVTVDVSIDTTPPGVPAGITAFDDAGAIQGSLGTGGVTDDATPLISGSGAEPGATITVYDNGEPIGSASVGLGGDWTFAPPTALAEGAHSLTFTATDADGNESAPSQPFLFTVDTIPPATPTIAQSTGAGLGGTAEPGAELAIDLDNDGTVDAVVQADADGNWSYVPGSLIPDGTIVSVTAIDAAGNRSPVATLVIDAQAPLAPIIDAAIDDLAGSTGFVASGGTSNDPTLVLTGTAPADSIVTIRDGALMLGTAIADSSGNWSFATPTLAEGSHLFSVTSLDPAGQSGGPSSGYAVTLDLTPPSAPTLNPTDGVTVSGLAEAGAEIAVDTNGDGTPDATTTAAFDGRWSVTFSPGLANGTLVSVVARDTAGNSSGPATGTVDSAIDSTPPPIPQIGSLTDDRGAGQGTLSSGNSSDDTTPLLAGSAEAGAIVSIYDNGVLIGSTVADGTGAWSFAPVLSEGVHNLAATATDGLGNESMPSSPFTVTIDTTPLPRRISKRPTAHFFAVLLRRGQPSPSIWTTTAR